MKRNFLFLLLIPVLLSACGQSVPEPRQFDEPTFYLEELPELEAYQGRTEISARYGEAEYVDQLVPAADYGALYPYVGRLRGQYNGWLYQVVYGLADAQGRIVVDPVYDYVFYTNDDAYLHLIYDVTEEDAEAWELYLRSEGSIKRTYHQFTTLDGSWVSPLFYGDSADLSEDRVVVTHDQPGEGEFWWDGMETIYQLFDLEGTLIATGQGRCGGFQEGLAYVYQEDRAADFYGYHYIDREGQTVIPGPFDQVNPFENGQALVSITNPENQNTLYLLIDREGNYLTEPDVDGYRTLRSDSWPYQYEYVGDYCGIFDTAGNVLIPPIYVDIWMGYSDRSTTVAVGLDQAGSYWLLDLEGGERWPLPGYPDYAIIGAGKWLALSYYPQEAALPEQSVELNAGGVAFYEGSEQIAFFDLQGYGSIDCRHIEGALFAVNYYTYDERINLLESQMLLYDAARREVLAEIEGWNYGHQSGEDYLLLDEMKRMSRKQIVDKTGEYLFANEVLSHRRGARDIGYLRDGVFQVQLDNHYGLLREDGTWLILLAVDFGDD